MLCRLKLFLTKHRTAILLILLTAGAALLRIGHFKESQLYQDEPGAYTFAMLPLSSFLFPEHNRVEAEINGVFYSVAVQGPWQRFCLNVIKNPNNSAMRFSSIIFGIASLFAVYFLGKKMGGARAGIAAAAFLAINGFHHYYSGIIRYHMFNFLMIIISSSLFLKACAKHSFKWWLLYFVSSWICIYSALSSIVVFPSHWLYLAILAYLRPKERKQAFIALPILAILTFVSYIPFPLIDPTASQRIDWYPYPSPIVYATLLCSFAGIKQHLAEPQVITCLTCVFALVIKGIYAAIRDTIKFMRKERQNLPPTLLAVIWLFIPIIEMTAISVLIQPVIIPRNCMFIFPAFALLLGIGWKELPRNILAAVSILFLISISVPALLRECRHDIKYEWNVLINDTNLHSRLPDKLHRTEHFSRLDLKNNHAYIASSSNQDDKAPRKIS